MAKNGAKHFSIADDDDDSDSELVKIAPLSHPFILLHTGPSLELCGAWDNACYV